jgi:hypothetical protein
MNYIPNASDLLEMSLWNFAEHAKELEQKMPQMTPEQRRAFIGICARIANMEQQAAA